MLIQQQPQRHPYLQPRLQLPPQYTQPNFIQQNFAPQSKKFDIGSSIPIARSIQYEVPLQTQNNDKKKQYSSEMVSLIKESQELKRFISEKDEEINKCKTNIQRLEQLIDYLEKEKNVSKTEQ